MKIIRFPICIIFLLLSVLQVQAQARQEHHSFVLYPPAGPKKPYVLTFPVTVSKPGEIRVYGKLDRKPAFMQVWAGILDKKSGKTVAWIVANPKRSSFQLRYGVDSLDLKNGGRYEIFISNHVWHRGHSNRRQRITGNFLLDYPVQGEPDRRARPVYPDLAIDEISLDATCHVQVLISNRGPGRMAGIFWKKNGPTIMLKRNGRSWGGVGLQVIDPDHELARTGGKVIYHSRLRVGRGETIQATIMPGPHLKDNDPGNNTRSVTLSCSR